ncbi:MAG: glycoside hydrolase family 25 protein [Ruminococcus sp.]|nr:glycoside hydrolase family 25 protein [Ruminococcus sp.]
MPEKKGVDISMYQGEPDFARLSKSVDFVVIRAGYGRYLSQTDSSFERNYAGCKNHGIPVGAYWFSYATTADEARLEAKACIAAVSGKRFEYPIYYDVEGRSLVGRAKVSAMCEAFCTELERAGYFAGIYMSRSPAQTMLTKDITKRYALWLAEYGSSLNWTGSVGMWQNSSVGRVAGIEGNVDTDICYIDYPELIKQAGLNGYGKPDKKTLDTEGFRRGDRGLGVYALKQLLGLADKAGIINASLADDGGFGSGTERAVNDLLEKLGCKPNGIAGEALIKKLGDILGKRL